MCIGSFTAMCVDSDNYFTEICSGSEAGSYMRLIDVCVPPNFGLEINKEEEDEVSIQRSVEKAGRGGELRGYRGTSLIRSNPPVGPSSSPMPRDLRGSYGGGHFLMGEVPLYRFRNLSGGPDGELSGYRGLQGYLARKKTPTPLGSP